MLIGIGGAVLLLGLLLFGNGSRVTSDGGRATDLVPIAPAAEVERVSAVPLSRDIPRKDLPPRSTLSFRGQTVSSAGEVLGTWNPEGLFADSSGGPARGRTDGTLSLSDGDLLEVPAGSEMTFVYGGEPGSINFLDALAFEVGKGSLMYGKDSGTLSLQSGGRGSVRPVVLRLSRPELVSRKRVKIKAELSPGVYVASVAASVSEGGVRYNFRVVVVE